jgi:nitroreductase
MTFSHAFPDTPGSDWPSMASELIQARQTVLPKRLMAPAPDAQQQQAILNAAAAAPDHGQLLPWRFIEVPAAQRDTLAEVFARALRERDGSATEEQLEQAREKAHRSPWLLLLVVDAAGGDAEVDVLERTLSAGCAVQNAMLMATALGFGSALTSGKALKSGALRTRFDLHAGEQAICFLSIGTVQSRRKPRARPAVAQFHHTLGQPPVDR